MSLQIQRDLTEFLKGKQRRFDFNVDCELKDRVRFIYKIVFPGWKKYRFYINFFIARVAQFIDYSPIKIFLYRLIGMKIGKGVFISADVILDPLFPSLIEIKDYVVIGWGAKLFTHECSGSKYRIGRILVEEGATIGGFSTIRHGVTIGKMAEVAAHSIVCEDVPDNSRYGVREVLKRHE